jgi:hypothetical protein
MPCVSSNNQAKSRSPGFIQDFYMPAGNHFKISFDLIIDSIEAPAIFRMTILGNGLPPQGFVWETDSLQSQRIENVILLDNDIDSVFIRFESKGYLKQNPAHDCDLGYLSAIVDHLETENLVKTQESKRSGLHISPNPFTNILNIESESHIHKWFLFDINGRLVLFGNANEINDIKALPMGVYIIKVVGDVGIYYYKIVKD